MCIQNGISENIASFEANTPENHLLNHAMISKPPIAPLTDRIRLSISICKTSRTRVAPRAPRTASSVPRLVALARVSPATFAKAMNSTSNVTMSMANTPGAGPWAPFMFAKRVKTSTMMGSRPGEILAPAD